MITIYFMKSKSNFGILFFWNSFAVDASGTLWQALINSRESLLLEITSAAGS
jgi:hypothetical protein